MIVTYIFGLAYSGLICVPHTMQSINLVEINIWIILLVILIHRIKYVYYMHVIQCFISSAGTYFHECRYH